MTNPEREYLITQTGIKKLIAAVRVADEVKRFAYELSLIPKGNDFRRFRLKMLNRARKYLSALPDETAVLSHITTLGEYNLSEANLLRDQYVTIKRTSGR